MPKKNSEQLTFKVALQLDGFCEHCHVIPGPCYFVTDDQGSPDFCLECAHNGDFPDHLYDRFAELQTKLEARYKEQQKELLKLEKELRKPENRDNRKKRKLRAAAKQRGHE